ncbi:MAG: hypothetical protein U1U88_001459 [Lawsonella clevelandensis]
MKPSRLIAGLTTSTILVGSLALAPHALAEPTTPTPKPTPNPTRHPPAPTATRPSGTPPPSEDPGSPPWEICVAVTVRTTPDVLASNTGLQLNETACYNATTQNYQWIRPAGILNSPNPPQVKAIDRTPGWSPSSWACATSWVTARTRCSPNASVSGAAVHQHGQRPAHGTHRQPLPRRLRHCHYEEV